MNIKIKYNTKNNLLNKINTIKEIEDTQNNEICKTERIESNKFYLS